MEQDFYRILGVDPKATAREIKRAYLKLARREHPDVNPGDREATVRFARIQEAWRVLSQRTLRDEYNRHGQRSSLARDESPIRGQKTDGKPGQWEQVLTEVFPEGSWPEAGGAPARGEDVHQVLELSFEESMRGVVRECRYQRDEPCPECRGRRWAHGAKVESCRDCEGRGVVEAPHGPWMVKRICPSCGGEGETGTPVCQNCRGRGYLPLTENRAIRIPAGSASGSRIIVAGAGQPGRRGGEAGDLLVTIKAQSHPLLERKGQNLYCVVPVTLTQAVLGGPVKVPTAEGRSTLRLPPGTQCAQQFTLRGKGVPSPGGGKRGDLYVTITVTIPSGEDPRVRRIFQELERAVPEIPRMLP